MLANLGTYVRARRQELGLTQIDIERRFGIPQPYLSGIEHGKIVVPSSEIRSRLAVALEVTPVDLLLAAGEITRPDLVNWASTAGITASVEEDEPLPRLLQDLEHDGRNSPRLHLALQIPRMTRREAAFLLVAFEHLPTEASTKRRESAGTPEAYRRWLERQDVVDTL